MSRITVDQTLVAHSRFRWPTTTLPGRCAVGALVLLMTVGPVIAHGTTFQPEGRQKKARATAPEKPGKTPLRQRLKWAVVPRVALTGLGLTTAQVVEKSTHALAAFLHAPKESFTALGVGTGLSILTRKGFGLLRAPGKLLVAGLMVGGAVAAGGTAPYLLYHHPEQFKWATDLFGMSPAELKHWAAYAQGVIHLEGARFGITGAKVMLESGWETFTHSPQAIQAATAYAADMTVSGARSLKKALTPKKSKPPKP